MSPVAPLSEGTTSHSDDVVLDNAEVFLKELQTLPSGEEITDAQLEVNTILPQQQTAGDMGTAALP